LDEGISQLEITENLAPAHEKYLASLSLSKLLNKLKELDCDLTSEFFTYTNGAFTPNAADNKDWMQFLENFGKVKPDNITLSDGITAEEINTLCAIEKDTWEEAIAAADRSDRDAEFVDNVVSTLKELFDDFEFDKDDFEVKDNEFKIKSADDKKKWEEYYTKLEDYLETEYGDLERIDAAEYEKLKEINTSEWEAFNDEFDLKAFLDLEWWVDGNMTASGYCGTFLIISCVLLFILLILGFVKCCTSVKKRRADRQQQNRDVNTGTGSNSIGHSSHNSPGSYNHERRRLQTPIFNLAREIGINDPAYDITKTFAHDLTEVKSPPTIVQEVCEFTGFAQKDLIWVIPLSCVTQVFWIYVGYKILKRCRRNRNNNDRSRIQRAT